MSATAPIHEEIPQDIPLVSEQNSPIKPKSGEYKHQKSTSILFLTTSAFLDQSVIHNAAHIPNNPAASVTSDDVQSSIDGDAAEVAALLDPADESQWSTLSPVHNPPERTEGKYSSSYFQPELKEDPNRTTIHRANAGFRVG